MADHEKFEQLMAIHTEQLFRIAYYYTKDLQIAEDIVQDVLLSSIIKNTMRNEER